MKKLQETLDENFNEDVVKLIQVKLTSRAHTFQRAALYIIIAQAGWSK